MGVAKAGAKSFSEFATVGKKAEISWASGDIGNAWGLKSR